MHFRSPTKCLGLCKSTRPLPPSRKQVSQVLRILSSTDFVSPPSVPFPASPSTLFRVQRGFQTFFVCLSRRLRHWRVHHRGISLVWRLLVLCLAGRLPVIGLCKTRFYISSHLSFSPVQVELESSHPSWWQQLCCMAGLELEYKRKKCFVEKEHNMLKFKDLDI